MKLDPDTLQLPKEPYRGILPFRLLDWRIFFERDIEAERLANLVTMYRGVLLYGQSGAGKSSLLNAGLLPHTLRRGRAAERIRVFPELGRELLVERIPLLEEGAAGDGLPAYLPSRFTSEDNEERVALSCGEFLAHLRAPSKLGEPLLIFDQFEELVTLFEENPKDQARFEQAQAARAAIEGLVCDLLLNDPIPVKIIFAFRDDYLARLTPLFSRTPNLLDQHVLLLPPRMELVTKIVRGPFLSSEEGERGLPGHFGDELSEELAEKLAAGIGQRRTSGIVNLSEVQALCLTLWRQPKLREELLRADDPAGVLQKILEAEAMSALKRFLPWDRISALALLSNLVTADGTRDVVSEENLISEARRIPPMWIYSRREVKKRLNKLLAETGLLRRSLSSGTTYYELTSEFLIPWLQRQQRQFRTLALVVWGYVSAGVLALMALGYWGYISVGVFALLFLVGFLAYHLNTERQRAEAAKRAADELIRFMQYDLSDTLGKFGRLDLMDAVNARIRQYHEQYPPEGGDLRALREKASALTQHGDLLLEEGNLNDALKSYRDSLGIADKLTRQDLGNAGWQRDLSVSYGKVGDVQSAQGDLAGALKSYRDSLGIRDKLARQDPGNAGWQRDLSVSYEKVGDVQSAQGDLAGALKSYRDSLGIANKLARQDPGNFQWQLDLAESARDVGSVLLRQNSKGEAKHHFESFRTITEQLGTTDRTNYLVQAYKANSRAYLADCENQRTRDGHAKAQTLLREAVKILETLKERTGLRPMHEGWLQDYQEKLNRLNGRTPRQENKTRGKGS